METGELKICWTLRYRLRLWIIVKRMTQIEHIDAKAFVLEDRPSLLYGSGGALRVQRILNRMRPGLHVIGANGNSITICGGKSRLTRKLINDVAQVLSCHFGNIVSVDPFWASSRKTYLEVKFLDEPKAQ